MHCWLMKALGRRLGRIRKLNSRYSLVYNNWANPCALIGRELGLWEFSVITLMIIENGALSLARSFDLSRYNHRAVIITLKASSFQNGSQIFWCFEVGNWSIILFSRVIINVIYTKIISRLRRREYRRIVTSTSSPWLFADTKVAFGD